jgi:hypothetical protein
MTDLMMILAIAANVLISAAITWQLTARVRELRRQRRDQAALDRVEHYFAELHATDNRDGE